MMKPYEQDAREILEKTAALKQQRTKRSRAVCASAGAFAVLLGAALLVRQVKSKPGFAPGMGSTGSTTKSATAGGETPELYNEPSDPSALCPGPLLPGESGSTAPSDPGVVQPFGTTNQSGGTDAPTAIAPPGESESTRAPTDWAPPDVSGTDVATTQGVTQSPSQPRDESGSLGDTQDDLPITIERLQTELGVGRRNETLDAAAADRYIADNKAQILYSLSMNGVPTDGNVTISKTGYTHLNLSGGGTWKELATDFRDYLIYNDDRLIAILTLWIDNGAVHASPAFGAPWFDDYNAFLLSHKGEALAFVYVGMVEAVVTPRGEVLNPMGLDLSDRFPDSANGNYYDYLAYPENTYVVP